MSNKPIRKNMKPGDVIASSKHGSSNRSKKAKTAFKQDPIGTPDVAQIYQITKDSTGQQRTDNKNRDLRSLSPYGNNERGVHNF